ncbi:hypothetical protein [Paenibacillus aquistagni]|uniref:hypothetical protein n=1 Tax=Paenibacillus aquistagni TaxID=1852522 RepID=UPI00145A5510|nr:hypothetical protein [Paenibacillus aquistagni]NMM52475.1 hypothetical protein [Paenibacillus aquistagni]
MRKFLFLNSLSAYLGFLFFVEVHLAFNVSRIARLTGWEPAFVMNSILLLNLLLIALIGVVYIFILASHFTSLNNLNYISCVTWFAYFIGFSYVITSLFPIVNPEDKANKVLGLITIFAACAYPFYILFIIFLARQRGQNK